jgi:hypothetical protein
MCKDKKVQKNPKKRKGGRGEGEEDVYGIGIA